MTRTIVITGATGEIAQEMVKRLPQDQLILLSRNLSDLKTLYGGLPHVTLLENDKLIFDRSVKIDILINNAGFGVFANLTALSEAQIEQQFQVNTILPIRLIRRFNPRIQVINIASMAGKLPTAKSSVYAASKAALIIFSDALRLEKPDLIVTTVNTGPVRTKFHENNKAYLEKVGRHAISAAFVADKIVKNLGKKKREINLPWALALAAKLRPLFPGLFDFFSHHFFNYK